MIVENDDGSTTTFRGGSEVRGSEASSNTSVSRLINIFSNEDSDFDFEVLVPEGMTNEMAIEKVSAAIKRVLEVGVSDTEPDGLSGEIETELDAAGFVTPSWAGRVCMENGEGDVYGD